MKQNTQSSNNVSALLKITVLIKDPQLCDPAADATVCMCAREVRQDHFNGPESDVRSVTRAESIKSCTFSRPSAPSVASFAFLRLSASHAAFKRTSNVLRTRSRLWCECLRGPGRGADPSRACWEIKYFGRVAESLRIYFARARSSLSH